MTTYKIQLNYLFLIQIFHGLRILDTAKKTKSNIFFYYAEYSYDKYSHSIRNNVSKTFIYIHDNGLLYKTPANTTKAYNRIEKHIA